MIQAAISSPPCTVRSSSRSRSRRTRLGPVLLPVPSLRSARTQSRPSSVSGAPAALRSCFQVAAGCCRSVGPCLDLRAGVRHQLGQPLEALAFSGLPRLCQPVRQPRLVTRPGVSFPVLLRPLRAPSLPWAAPLFGGAPCPPSRCSGFPLPAGAVLSFSGPTVAGLASTPTSATLAGVPVTTRYGLFHTASAGVRSRLVRSPARLSSQSVVSASLSPAVLIASISGPGPALVRIPRFASSAFVANQTTALRVM